MPRGMRQSTLSYATQGSAGADLTSAENKVIPANRTVLVRSNTDAPELDLQGIRLNTAALVVPRSGMALNSSVTVINSPGLIDPDYTGNISVILHNFSDVDYEVREGDKIAQLMLVPFVRAYGAQIASKQRQDGGFGSTGR